MHQFRFSPISDVNQLMEAIKYIHFSCFKLCKDFFGEYLPVAGNLGVFCHYDDEFRFLTALKENMTDKSDNWNNKYFRLRQPIIVPAQKGISETIYTYLYIRRPDSQKPQVGDVDFVVKGERFAESKRLALSGHKAGKVAAEYRSDLDMVCLSNPDIDVLAYITDTFMNEKGKVSFGRG